MLSIAVPTVGKRSLRTLVGTGSSIQVVCLDAHVYQANMGDCAELLEGSFREDMWCHT